MRRPSRWFRGSKAWKQVPRFDSSIAQRGLRVGGEAVLRRRFTSLRLVIITSYLHSAWTRRILITDLPPICTIRPGPIDNLPAFPLNLTKVLAATRERSEPSTDNPWRACL